MNAPTLQSLPHSSDAEQQVIGACLVDGDETITRCKEAGISPASFYDPANALIFRVMVELHPKCRPVKLEVLAEELATQQIFEQVGGWPYLMQVTDKIPTTAHARHFIEKVRTFERQRATIRAADVLRAQASAPVLGPDDLSAIIRAATDALRDGNSSGVGLGPGVTAASLSSAPPPRPPEVIAGVLYAGGTMMLSGPSKAHKTFSFLDLGLSVATGLPWLGFCTAKAPVLYVNFELSEHSLARRVTAICDAKGIGAPADFRVFNLRGKVVTMDMLAAELPRLIEQYGAKLVIIDPWYLVAARSGAEENSNDAQARILSDLEHLVTPHGAALVIGHHFAKGDASSKNSIDRAAGAGAMARWGDAIATLTQHEQGDAMTLEFHLRDFAPVPAVVVRWQYPLWLHDEQLDPARLLKPGRKDEHPASKALAVLEEGMTTKEWRDKLGWPETTFARKRDELSEAGKITSISGYWYHTPTSPQNPPQ